MSGNGDRDWDDRASVRVPDPDVRTHDRRFRGMVIGNARIERLFTGTSWAEGPCWFGDMQCLVWSDIPASRMLRWDAISGATSTFRQPSRYANGNTRDRQGRLVTCEQQTRRVVRTEPSGECTVLLDRFEGRRLNAPNDVVVSRDGSTWFSDPGYGISNDFEGGVARFELPRRIYRIDGTSGQARVVSEAFERPNGLCFSPDERLLYVTDTAVSDDPDKPSRIHVFDVGEDGTVGEPRVFHDFADARPGFADGIRIDAEGNVWAACGWAGDGFDGVQVFAPDGALLGQIKLPEACANVTFGGVRHNRLFMAATTSLYVLDVGVRGAQMW